MTDRSRPISLASVIAPMPSNQDSTERYPPQQHTAQFASIGRRQTFKPSTCGLECVYKADATASMKKKKN
ncbi:hypothetical protein OUZ56_004950 [Daphnia magna]|uniref:Uncharacterized protein n=1 Tax=Daphnia magna TaxID=35525 RepID=A0ABQ9YRC8_9CRUS|nr:hypothetical protein OUZ56_004950 [Daphnia magna]